MKKKLVLPGEMIGTSEEFIPGEGVFEENGKIFSKNVGIVEIDKKDKRIMVKPKNPPAMLKNGDVVIGTVSDVKSAMVVVSIEKITGKNRAITGEKTGAIHISKVSSGYVKDIGSEYKRNDIIRAKVIQVIPSVQLSTAEPDLGVIWAVCPKCKNVLEKDGNMLVCRRCERTEHRKIARDYREGAKHITMDSN